MRGVGSSFSAYAAPAPAPPNKGAGATREWGTKGVGYFEDSQHFLFVYIQCSCGCLEDQITECGEEREAGRFRSWKYMLRLSKKS